MSCLELSYGICPLPVQVRFTLTVLVNTVPWGLSLLCIAIHPYQVYHFTADKAPGFHHLDKPVKIFDGSCADIIIFLTNNAGRLVQE